MNKEEFKYLILSQFRTMSEPVISAMYREDMTSKFNISQFKHSCRFLASEFGISFLIERIRDTEGNMSYQVIFNDVDKETIHVSSRADLSGGWEDNMMFIEEVTTYKESIRFSVYGQRIIVNDYVFDLRDHRTVNGTLTFNVVTGKFVESSVYIKNVTEYWHTIRNGNPYVDMRNIDMLNTQIKDVCMRSGISNENIATIVNAFNNSIFGLKNDKSAMEIVVNDLNYIKYV